jgi:cytochrome c553
MCYGLKCAVCLRRTVENAGKQWCGLQLHRGVDMISLRASITFLLASAAQIAIAAEQPAAAPVADPAKAQPIAAAVCAACHGADGNSPIPTNPNIAGQHSNYLYKQLTDYKSGRRKNPIMMGIAANLSDADIRNLAAYFSQQKAKPGAAKDAELVAAGQRLYRGGDIQAGVPACASCHSADGAGIPIQYPRVGGQHGEYTLAQLQLFRSGERANDTNSVMRTISQRLTDKAMSAVAEYIAGLK